MDNRVEKIFNHWTLLAINIILIALVESSGTFFADSGLIHLIAVIFVFLGASRIFIHYDVYDAFLRPFLHASILALITLAASHVVEYASHAYLDLPYDAISTNVINFYLASLLLIAFGSETFLKAIKKEARLFRPAALLGVIAYLLAIGASFGHPSQISLHPSNWPFYFYLLAVISVPIFVIWRLLVLRSHVSILVRFIDYLTAACLLISTSALQYVLYGIFADLEVPLFRQIYLSHFLFYAALSLMFLAYVRLAHLPGLYADIEKENRSKLS